MMKTVSPEVYLAVRSIFLALYLLWAFLWARVMWYYGRAAYTSWLANGGRWRFVFHDLLQPFTWALQQTLCRYKLFKGKEFCGTIIPSPYESGHLLRFSIFLGSLTPIVFGLQFGELDRSDWTFMRIFITMVFVWSSIIAAGGHLFLAFRTRPEAWRKLIVRCCAWLVFMPGLFAFSYYCTGWPTLLPWNAF